MLLQCLEMTGNDSLSSVLGWISIACWIVVYSPQIYENYLLQSGEGVSLLFVYIWLLGDAFNLAGAIIANLIPTIIILGAYYTACDLILLGQIFYYRRKTQKKNRAAGDSDDLLADDERTRLLPGGEGSEAAETAESVIQPWRTLLVKYSLCVVFVVAVGVGAWWINEGRFHTNEPNVHGFSASAQGEGEKPNHYALVQFFGWSSAVLFLGARIPQILKNFETRCAGLSPAMFLFSILGNTTYCLSIFAKSMEWEYLLTNAGWIAGSGLTVFLDAMVLLQFMWYRRADMD